MTKNRGSGCRRKRVITESRATNAPASSSLIRKSCKRCYSKSRHFEATRGDRVQHIPEIVPDVQIYSNFATWTSANTSAVTFKLMSIGMLDRTSVIADIHTHELTI